mmetsp:Transcript_4919/g.9247  ORF Transcript_4919/g.9247 Transcript_4919/m.9247 type:complete len:916 (+) Transcript_4919:105-2852(+)
MLNILFSFLFFAKVATPGSSANVDDILASLTLEEKIGQMNQIDINVFVNDSIPGLINYTMIEEWISKYKIGSILNTPFSEGQINGKVGWNASEFREIIHNIQTITQKYADVEAAIPILFGIDSIHGSSYVYEATLFPQEIATAATFNTSRSYDAGRVAAQDTLAAGIPWLFSPVLGLGLNPLWARHWETFGEDPYLAARVGEALIQGAQASEDFVNSIPSRAAACMKHFIAYSTPATGHDRSPVQLPDRVLKELFLPSFQAAIDAGVITAMEGYHEVGGIPMVASYDYLSKLLRYDMQFEGLLVTDYKEILNLHEFHMTAPTETDAVLQSLTETSIDMSMVPLDNSFFESTLSLVQSGKISVNRIDDSVRRILDVKNTLGLLDNPVVPLTDPLVDLVGQASDWEMALDSARESITLVKNNESTLPIVPEALDAADVIFVSGPTAKSLVRQSGGWTYHWQGALDDSEFTNGVTVVDGMAAMFPTATVVYEPGPSVTASDIKEVNMTDVIQQAQDAKIVLVCLGEETYTEKPGDINDLTLAQGQIEYMEALTAALDPSIPIILILLEGRPRLLQGLPQLADAVLLGYLPGPMGGQAIAEIISGDVSPSGRLPFTYPKDHGSIPYPYHHKPSSLCIDPNDAYNNILCETEWAFGTGLTYSDFQVSDLQLSTQSIDESGSIVVTATVTNAGSIPAKYSLLLFLNQMYRRVTPEYKLLKRFTKVDLSAGESTVVQWEISAATDLVYVGLDGRYVMESGEFRVGLGAEVDCRANATSPLCATFTLQTSPSYQPVCSAACDILTPGLCGVSLSLDECLDTCESEQWTWEYVQCLEEIDMNENCDTATCYNAAYFTSTDNNCDDDMSAGTEGLVLSGVALGGILVGMAIMWLLSSFFHIFRDKNSYTQQDDVTTLNDELWPNK